MSDLLDLRVPLLEEKLGLGKSLEERHARRIEERLKDLNGRMKQMIAAALATHRTNLDDVLELDEMFRPMEIDVQYGDFGVHLLLKDVPREVTFDDEHISEGQIELISEIIRDAVYSPEFPEGLSPVDLERRLYQMVRRAGIFRVDPRIRTFIWGGHSIPEEEYNFVKRVGYLDGMFEMEQITGCGPGVMKAPFTGSFRGYKRRRIHKEALQIGFSEVGILAFEPPNDDIDTLVVFPDIEKRMEAFIRAAHRGRVHPGGSGTMEEIMTFLGMKMHPENKGLYYPFELLERPGGDYVPAIRYFFRVCFGNILDGYIDLLQETPENYRKRLMKTNKPLKPQVRWNRDLYMPLEINTPFEVTFESIEGLDLTREQEPHLLIAHLRRFFSAMVHVVAKNPLLLEEWGSERPLIRGDKNIVLAVDNLIRQFNDRNRLRMKGPLKEIPYRTE